MSFASYILQGVGLAGQVFDMYGAEADQQTSKQAGYATANANEERIRRSSRQELGTLRASIAQDGFTPDSQAELYGQSAANAELDALTARYEGEINGWRADEQIRRAKEKRAYMLDPVFQGRRSMGSLFLGGGVSYFGGRQIRKG